MVFTAIYIFNPGDTIAYIQLSSAKHCPYRNMTFKTNKLHYHILFIGQLLNLILTTPIIMNFAKVKNHYISLRLFCCTV